MFDLGNIVTIAITLIVLAAYRILDRDNRSLEKVKKFADRLQGEMAAYADRRADDLKAYAVELDVHQQAAKEVLRRVQAAETALGERASAIDAMAARVAQYDAALGELKAMSESVDHNLTAIRDESAFVDGVARALKSAKSELDALKASMAGLREGFAQDLGASKRELEEAFNAELRSALDDAQGAVESLRIKAEESAVGVGAMHAAAAGAAEDRYKAVEARLDEAFRRAREEGEKLEDAAYRRLEEQIEARGDKLSAALDAKFESIRDQSKDRFAKVEAKFQEAALAYQQKVKDSLKQYQEEIHERQAELKAAFKETIGDARRSAEEAAAEHGERLSTFKAQLEDAAEAQERRLAGLANSLSEAERGAEGRIKALSEKFTDRSAELESRIVGSFESRAAELRGLVEHGLERLEGMRLDADAVEKGLRDSMAGVERRVEEDFALFGRDLAARQRSFEEEIKSESARIRASVQDLEADLNALKSRAYANVSEKLRVFEDEFFADLKKRREDADEKFALWRADMDERLAAAQRDAEAAQAASAKAWTEESRATLAEAQARIQEQAAKLAEQLEAHREAISGRMAEADSALSSLKAGVKADLDDARAAANAYLNAELERWKHEGAERIKAAERAAEADGKASAHAEAAARAALEKAEKAVLEQAEQAKAKFGQAFKAAEKTAEDALAKLNEQLAAGVAALAADWDKEKKRVIDNAKAERDSLSRDIRGLSEEAGRFRQDLSQKTAQALEDLKRSYDILASEAARKARESAAEMDGSIERYRDESKSLKSGFDAARLALSQGLDEERKARERAFAELDKQLKAFQAETRAFERADELKAALAEAVEAMKGDLAKAESRRGELAELEAQYARVKRLEDELSQKIARFLAEKRRFDSMEADFQRLISLSQSVDQKLSQVTSSYDQLTDIQAELRRLTEAADEAAEKYERIERKASVLDATADAVDKNFQAIAELERNVRSMDADVREVPDRIIELKRSLDEVSNAKPRLDAAIARLDQLGASLDETERRAAELTKAREWLARAETRFEELNKKTQDHLKLLNELLKDEPSAGKKEKGAPSLSVQEAVRKLAHQGWKVEEIARAVKLSRGEVELILELGRAD